MEIYFYIHIKVYLHFFYLSEKSLARGVYYYKINATDLEVNQTEVGGKLIRM
jgi:hypothetical protein